MTVDGSRALEVVLASNFPKDDTLGTSRTPLRLVGELEKIGVKVSDLWANDLLRAPRGRANLLTAPVRMAALLSRVAKTAHVVDIAGWDGWVYARLARWRRPGQAVVARSNGLWYRGLEVEGGEPRSSHFASALYQRHVYCRWERASFERAHAAVFLSTADRDDVVRAGWKGAEETAVVHPAVDGFFASAVPLEARRDVAFVGTFFHRKGSDIVAARDVPGAAGAGDRPADVVWNWRSGRDCPRLLRPRCSIAGVGDRDFTATRAGGATRTARGVCISDSL